MISTYSSITNILNNGAADRTATSLSPGRRDPGIAAPGNQFPTFSVPNGFAFAVQVVNPNGTIILRRNFVSPEDFQAFCDSCTNEKNRVSFVSGLFLTAQTDSVATFARAFFAPSTTAISSPTLKGCVLAFLLDLITLPFRLLALPLTYYKHHYTPPHPLKAELLQNAQNPNQPGPYVDVHFRAIKASNAACSKVHMGERIFFRPHSSEEESSYCNSTTQTSISLPPESLPQQDDWTSSH